MLMSLDEENFKNVLGKKNVRPNRNIGRLSRYVGTNETED
jgi:hypothetical protein